MVAKITKIVWLVFLLGERPNIPLGSKIDPWLTPSICPPCVVSLFVLAFTVIEGVARIRKPRAAGLENSSWWPSHGRRLLASTRNGGFQYRISSSERPKKLLRSLHGAECGLVQTPSSPGNIYGNDKNISF
jgi:hypothetical protein